MNDKEKESIADAFREIGKIFCGLAEKLCPTIQTESEDLFESKADTTCVTRKPRKCFRRMIYVKFEGRNWKKYTSIKDFYEEITRKKLDTRKTTPLSLDLPADATFDDMIREFKRLVVRQLTKYNYPRTLEKIARETVDDVRYEA